MSTLSKSAVKGSSVLSAEMRSIAWAAELLDVTPRTIRNYVARGVLTGYRAPTGRKIMLRTEDVRSLLRPIANGAAR